MVQILGPFLPWLQYVLIPLVSAIIGAAIGGWFLRRDAAERSRFASVKALRVLLLELRENSRRAKEMVDVPAEQKFFRPDGPNPTTIRRSIWDSQLMEIASILPPGDLDGVSQAYMLAEKLERQRLPDGTYRRTVQVLNDALSLHDFFSLAVKSAEESLSLYATWEYEGFRYRR